MSFSGSESISGPYPSNAGIHPRSISGPRTINFRAVHFRIRGVRAMRFTWLDSSRTCVGNTPSRFHIFDSQVWSSLCCKRNGLVWHNQLQGKTQWFTNIVNCHADQLCVCLCVSVWVGVRVCVCVCVRGVVHILCYAYLTDSYKPQAPPPYPTPIMT